MSDSIICTENYQPHVRVHCRNNVAHQKSVLAGTVTMATANVNRHVSASTLNFSHTHGQEGAHVAKCCRG